MPDILAGLIAFVDDHRWCADLDGTLDDGVVWLVCSCGAELARVTIPTMEDAGRPAGCGGPSGPSR